MRMLLRVDKQHVAMLIYVHRVHGITEQVEVFKEVMHSTG